MSAFCYECSEYLFDDGKMTEFKGLTTKKQEKQGIYRVVACEECGMILVHQDGRKVKSAPEGCLVCFEELRARR